MRCGTHGAVLGRVNKCYRPETEETTKSSHGATDDTTSYLGCGLIYDVVSLAASAGI